ncbi:MAG: hypothetical protein IJ019_03960 [Alphaproteobacteria bacterium]|nr:hypothetical protein [Alphaproteobacteria bacterium]
MKKIMFTLATLIIFSFSAKAETIVVIDDNGYVKQQIFTSNSANIPSSQQLTVVRETPQVNNAYYYDAPSTSGTILAGVTTAVIGTLLFNEFKPHKHHHYKPISIRHYHNNRHRSKKH